MTQETQLTKLDIAVTVIVIACIVGAVLYCVGAWVEFVVAFARVGT